MTVLGIRTAMAALVGCVLFGAGSTAQTTITFATYPGGVQVPASDVSINSQFSPKSVMGDQFAALGIHFNNTGLLFPWLGFPGGSSTYPDGWCQTGGYTCSPNNILLVNSPSGGQSFDTIKMTFDVPQTAVEMDVSNSYLCGSPSAVVQLSGGTLLTA